MTEVQRYKKALKECRYQRDFYIKQYIYSYYPGQNSAHVENIEKIRKHNNKIIRKVLDGNS